MTTIAKQSETAENKLSETEKKKKNEKLCVPSCVLQAKYIFKIQNDCSQLVVEVATTSILVF